MAKDKHKGGHGHGSKHAAEGSATSAERGSDRTPLPGSRAELLALHAETRRRRNAAPLNSPEHRAAVDLIGRIEVEIARLERAMDPPLV
ncbi:MAG TPA: hypothetical protein VFR14_08225 [Candidatus Limnocylindrales bacterium]|nr:hypothetical protein [Candidatus Limnocylindrales bacterium]